MANRFPSILMSASKATFTILVPRVPCFSNPPSQLKVTETLITFSRYSNFQATFPFIKNMVSEQVWKHSGYSKQSIRISLYSTYRLFPLRAKSSALKCLKNISCQQAFSIGSQFLTEKQKRKKKRAFCRIFFKFQFSIYYCFEI